MRRLGIVALLALAHFALSILLVAARYAAAMGRFETGAPPSPGEHAADVLARVILFPVVVPLGQYLPRAVTMAGFPGGHLIFVANSLLWAVALATAWRRIARRRRAGEWS